MKKIAAILILLCLGTGCAPTQKQLTREESLELRRKQIEATQRVYSGVTKDQVLVAVDRLLRLADHDFQIQHTEDGLIATRNWSVYLVLAATMGVDHWFVNAVEVPEGVKVTVRVIQQSSGIYGAPTIGGDGVYAGSLPPIEATFKGNALYALFFARLDYLLGKSDKWISCKDLKAFKTEKALRGPCDPLCNSFNIDDKPPT